MVHRFGSKTDKKDPMRIILTSVAQFSFPVAPLLEDDRSEGFPAWDIWFLHTVPQGSYQMGRVVGTPPPSSPSPSVGFTGGLSPPGPPTLLD